MSWQLQGPFALDLALVTGSARSAITLARAGAGPSRVALGDAPEAPGLYLLWRAEDQTIALAGFWLIFGPSWLDLGPDGRPDNEPPFAAELLGAATEEVWWQTLMVWPVEGAAWRPAVVLEWPHELASRAELPPMGVPVAIRTDTGGADDGDWVVGDVAPRREAPAPAVAVVHPELPVRRSLLTLVRGELSHDRARHSGRFSLVWPAAGAPGSNDPERLSVEMGLDAPPLQASGEQHRLGPAIDLGPRRVGFPLTGWLTRSLTVWPERADQVAAGALQDRDVGSPWKRQIRQAFGSTAAVVAAVVLVAAAVYFAARPREQPAPAAVAPAPQPAMSVCSADHQAYMDELRCQIRHLASGETVYDRVCSDPDSTERVSRTSEDLQAAWCGLRDRDLDGWKATARGDAFAEMAVSKACFNVLGQPYAYEAKPDAEHGGVVLPDPAMFLDDRDLGLRALAGLLGELDAACDVYRRRVEGQVSGAILASAIGQPAAPDQDPTKMSESARLRATVMDQVTAGVSADEARCVRAGADEGVSKARAWPELCGGPDALDEKLAAGEGWQRLGGDLARGGVIDAYTAARYGAGDRSPSEPLWACHETLSGRGRPAPGPARAWWDLTVPELSAYTVDHGAIQSQLVLDASLRAFSEGTSAGQCWGVVNQRLARYTPVHPLLGSALTETWPSEEQQLCGQICAASFRVRQRGSDGVWATPGADLGLCMMRAAPEGSPDFGRGTLDRLRLPWNEGARVTGERGRGRGPATSRWQEPDAAEICAFNLVAQGYFPPELGSVLVEDLAPPLWAGSTETGSGLAGGAEGAAARAATALSSYGNARSVATCGYVATQCLMSGALHVTENGRLQPYLWVEAWQQWVADLANREDAAASVSPWCGLVRSYLKADGTLPEGQLDYPCARGVDETRRGVEATLRALAQGTAQEGR